MAMALHTLPMLMLGRANLPTPCCSPLRPQVLRHRVAPDHYVEVRCTYNKIIPSHVYSARKDHRVRFELSIPLFLSGRGSRCIITSAAASEPGLEESEASVLMINDRRVTVDSREDGKIHVRVDVTSNETQKTFNDVLAKLGREAGPIPGFRRQKGGKTSNVPKFLLLQMLGQSRVRGFVIQEIIRSAVDEFVKKEDLKVKKDFKTRQSSEELESAFEPGKEFGFNATIELEETEPEITD